MGFSTTVWEWYGQDEYKRVLAVGEAIDALGFLALDAKAQQASIPDCPACEAWSMAMLPLAVPGIVMAFGYLALSREGQPLHALMLGENPLLLLVVAYAMRRLPYVIRSAAAGLQQVSPTLEEAAQNLGAPPLRTLWRITLPLVAPNLLAGALLAFSFAMLEVSDSMILAQQTLYFPITKAIYSLSSALGDGPGLAAALGVWSMVFLTITLLGAGVVLGRKLGALFRV